MATPGGLVVALIEDEPLVRVPLARGLSDAGFTVVSAANGAEALDLLADPQIRIAVIDIRLPGRLDGLGVAREIRRRHPDLKVILTSGGVPSEDVSALGAFVRKPIRVQELVDMVRRLAGPIGRTGDPS